MMTFANMILQLIFLIYFMYFNDAITNIGIVIDNSRSIFPKVKTIILKSFLYCVIYYNFISHKFHFKKH